MRFEVNNLPGEIDFECNSDTVRRIVQNVKNLLVLRMGEIPFDRQRGFDWRLYDLPIGELRARLAMEIDRVLLWERRALLVNCTADIVDGTTVIKCVVEINEE